MKEKLSYYFKHSNEEGTFYLVRRISWGKNVISYQTIGEYTAQEKGSLRLFKKRVHKRRIGEMDKNVAGIYSLESVLESIK